MVELVIELSTAHELFRTYLFYCCLLGLKMLVMSFLTARQRLTLKVFANPEDAAKDKVQPRIDERVERVRRAHLNDVENILVFFIVSFVYILTNPSHALALLLFRIFTAARFLHTFVYAVHVVPQPSRALAFMVGSVVTIYMAVQGLLHFM